MGEALKELHLVVPPEWIPRWFAFLRRGFGVPANSGSTLMDFLCHDLGLSPDTVETRVQTVLLDGRPVDDLFATRITLDAVVALSAALPGLAGACLRKGGVCARLRHTLSHRPVSPPTGRLTAPETLVTVKVFNILAAEWGPKLLNRGIVLSGGELAPFLAAGERCLWNGRGTWGGRPITAAFDLAERVAAHKQVRVAVRAGS